MSFVVREALPRSAPALVASFREPTVAANARRGPARAEAYACRLDGNPEGSVNLVAVVEGDGAAGASPRCVARLRACGVREASSW